MPEKTKRPVILTIFCILGFIGVPVTVFSLSSAEARELLTDQYGSLFVPATILSLILGFLGLLGMWMIKNGGYIFTRPWLFLAQQQAFISAYRLV